MAVDLSKVMDLADGLEIYKDLRDRIKNIPVPEVPVVGLLINNIRMPINENKYIKFGVQNGVQLTMDEVGGNTVFNLEADLRDVRINGTTIRSQGIANIPTMSTNNFGVAKLGMKYNTGITITDSGELKISPANITNIQSSPNLIQPLVSYFVPDIAFFGLAKAAGDTTQSQLSTTAHTYTDEAKQAILKMLGLDGILGDFENTAVASKAYAIGETFVYNGKRYRATAAIAISDVIAPGTNCELAPISLSDIQINGTSILNNGIANIPAATSSDLGAVKVDSTLGINIQSNKKLVITKASDEYVKSGANLYKPIVPANQHTSVFYALAKLAGAEMDNSSNPVGTYTEAALEAIQKLFGLDGIFGDYELSATASKAYAIGETFIYNGKRYRATAAIAQSDAIAPGTNCELDPLDGKYVRNTDYASGSKFGVVKTKLAGGTNVDSVDHTLIINRANDSWIKAGTNLYAPIVPSTQHISAFYALAKLAGTDLANETVTVGTYPQTAKTAIQTMLGIEADIPLVETLTGATASITGMPNVRYICDTAISELTITPPASGSIVVRFTAGSNCIVSLPQTVKLPEWFDISSLEAGTTYEIIITDGVYGGVMSWA